MRTVFRYLESLINPSVRGSAVQEFQLRYEEIARDKTSCVATLWLWQQVLFLASQRLFTGLRTWTDSTVESLLMTRRRFQKERTFMLVNGLGLAAGLFCTLIILAFIRQETKYDRFHEKADCIYRLTLDAFLAGETIQGVHSSAPLAPALKEASPDVEAYARLYPLDGAVVSTETEKFNGDRVFFADAAFLEVFSFPVLAQQEATVLDAPMTAVITRSAALRYFGSLDAPGKTLIVHDGLKVTVTGVLADPPKASHVQFDVLCSMSTLRQTGGDRLGRWIPFSFYSYVLLRDHADLARIQAIMGQLIETHLGGVLKAVGGSVKIGLQPLTSIHLHSRYPGELETNGNAQSLLILSAIGLFVLVVAGLNALNLMTARRLVLAKEMTIRQTLGAGRGRLIGQMFMESLWATLAAAVLAWILILLFSRSLSGFLGFRFFIEGQDVPWLALATLGVVFIVAVSSGLYPAWALMRNRRLVVYRSQSGDGTRSKGRHVLVLLQFAISIVLIIASGIIAGQLRYFETKDLGFEKTRQLILTVEDSRLGAQLKTAIMSLPGVMGVGSANRLPGHDYFKQPVLPEGRTAEERVNINDLQVDPDYFPTLGIPLVAGRNFDWNVTSDPQRAVIINESAARLLDWDDPIGKSLSLDPRTDDRRVIVGVVRDFHFESLHHAIAPLYVDCRFDTQRFMVVHVRSENFAATLAGVESAWKRITQGRPFAWQPLDRMFDFRYQQEQRLIRLIRLFTVLALWIAALGLWGMVVHTTERRTKEIGIRRTLGASVVSVGWLISHQMLRWILLANGLAWPLAYWLARGWLYQFAFHYSPSPWIYVRAALFVLFVGVVAVGWRTWRAARANPVRALRYE